MFNDTAPTISAASLSSLPYEEPAITTVLVLASFVLVLNCVNALLDRVVYCGLVGQILIGVAWGTPGGNWLSLEEQKTIVQLGYLGLILLVYEGGLSTSLSSIKRNVWLALLVAGTGIGLPIAFSFLLIPLMNASKLQAFAAGAALCSTSLGTTFTVLSTCDLVSTRLGTILTTAAMIDDVVGLVMVQIVAGLGSGAGSSPGAETIARPLGVSIGIVLSIVLFCRYLILPLSQVLVPSIRMLLSLPLAAFALQSLFLLAVFTGASYAGTSGLFAAYLAGAVLTWWDKTFAPGSLDYVNGGGRMAEAKTAPAVYDSKLASVTDLLLKPFFFASIGFSVPISQLFDGPVVWRGAVYTLLMLAAKGFTAVWLLRRGDRDKSGSEASLSLGDGPWPSHGTRKCMQSHDYSFDETASTPLYSPLLLGFAMTARGEIGYLIASVAESSGVFTAESETSGTSEIFLVVIWAVTMCTIIGPLVVGLLARRVKRFEREKGKQRGRLQALGKWGEEAS